MLPNEAVTVLGPVAPEELGITQMHEHLIVDMYGPLRNPLYRDYVLDDVDLAVDELSAFKEAGGRTVVDVTAMGLGRDPAALKQIAERTGLHVVAATGYYTEAYHSSDVHQKSIDELADIMFRDIQVGMENTGVRAGIIGEIGTIGPAISQGEEKVFRAAARAQLATGAAITTHTRLGELAPEQLDILEDEGVDLHRVIIGHQENKCHDPAYHEAIARRGAYVQFDCVGEEHYSPTLQVELPGNPERIKAIVNLVERGYASQILLSSDICQKPMLCQYGGWGYGYLLTEFVPMMEEAGIGRDTIHTILVDNPKHVLPF